MSEKVPNDVEIINQFCKSRDSGNLKHLTKKAREEFIKESLNVISTSHGDQDIAWMVLKAFKKMGEAAQHSAGEQKHSSITTIVSWNVNSLRSRIFDTETAACKRKPRTILATSPLGLLIKSKNPDVICFQETKCSSKNLTCLVPEGFQTFWNCATKQISWNAQGKAKIKPSTGYSGVAIWSKIKPDKVDNNLPYLKKESSHLLDEGRILTAFFGKLVIVNTYTPNTLRAGNKRKDGSYPNPELIKHRRNWDFAMGRYLAKLSSEGFSVVWCGDMNVARGRGDIYWGNFTKDLIEKLADVRVTKNGEVEIIERKSAPLDKAGEKAVMKYGSRYQQALEDEVEGGGAGYRLEEREGLEKILKRGFKDVYRELYPKKYGFTYWDLVRPPYRGINYGLRIDYFVVNQKLFPKIRSMEVLKDLGVKKGQKVPSDHAPIVLKLKL